VVTLPSSYRPWNFGGRLAMKAATPSTKSSVPVQRAKLSASACSCVSIEDPSDWDSSRLVPA